jgi:hypothetical protein
MTSWCPHQREVRTLVGDQLLPELAGLSMGYLEPEPFEAKFRPNERIDVYTVSAGRLSKYAFGKAVFCPWCESGIHVLGRPDICVQRNRNSAAWRFTDKVVLIFETKEWEVVCRLPRDAALPPDISVDKEFSHEHGLVYRWGR